MKMRLRPFSVFSKKLPGRSGKGVHPSTIWRWHRHGLDTPFGRVFLKAKKVGNIWCTTWPWLNQFFDSLTQAPPPIDTETAAQRARRLAAIDAELDALGM